jgi:hypothetical protein
MLSARFLLRGILCAGVLLPAVVGSGQTASSPKLPEAAVKMLNKQVGWDTAEANPKNPSGLRFRFVKIDEDRFALPEAKGHSVRYRMFVSGLAEGPKYTLGIWKIGSELAMLSDEVYVNSKGLLMVHKPRPEQENSNAVGRKDEMDLSLQAAKGEPVRFVLGSADGKLVVPGTVVPFPIESDTGRCRLEARLGLPDAQAVLIYADGLPPNSAVPLNSDSEGEAMPTSLQVNGKGHASTVDLPFIDGVVQGVLKVAIRIPSCNLSVEIQWGTGTYHVQ